MDKTCPSCGKDLAGRYLGIGRPRCPNCSSFLEHNTHPSELRVSIIEPAGYVIAAVGIALGIVFANAGKVIAGLVVVAWLAFSVAWLFRSYSAVPHDWPRWRLAAGQAGRQERRRRSA